MKKFISIILCTTALAILPLTVSAENLTNYTFDNIDNIKAVTNKLAENGSAVVEEGVLKLNSSYGLDLGEVGSTFSVAAMVNVSSVGDFETVFFKNMGDGTNQKWTGFKYEKGIPTVWTQGDGYEWEKAVVAKDNYTNKWVHVAYVEADGKASLYLDGVLIGEGNVVKGSGHLYLGATLWSGDAIDASIDNLVVFDHALTIKEVQEEHEKNVDYYINIPEIALEDINLTKKVGTAFIKWTSSDESIITTDGTVERCDEDKTVTLKAFVKETLISEYNVRVLKKSKNINDKVILSYDFTEIVDGVVLDKSGNENNAIAHNGLEAGYDGATFDGVDDYVELSRGVISDCDNITITATFKPDGAQKHVSLYTFGNGTEDGYMFLNPSRPSTNYLRFAATKTNAENEVEIASIPGIRHNEWATVTVVIRGTMAQMYVNGDLVMDGDLGMTVSDLGKTAFNYIAKSLYIADPHFKGIVSEFTIYNYAMNDEEIENLYKKDEAQQNGIGIYAVYDDFGNLVNVSVNKAEIDELGLIKGDHNTNADTFKLYYWSGDYIKLLDKKGEFK